MDVVVEHDDGLVEDAADVDDEDEEEDEEDEEDDDDDAGDDVDYIYNIGSCSLEGALRRCFGAKHQTNVNTSKH